MIPIVVFVVTLSIGLWSGGLINRFTLIYNSVTTNKYSGTGPRLLTAVIFATVILIIEPSIELLVTIPFVIALLLITVCDYRFMIIPDKVVLLGILYMGVMRIWIHSNNYWDYVLAAIFGGGIFLLLKLVGRLLTRSDSLGDGDIKLILFTGLVLGLKLTLLSFLIFSFLGFIIGLALILNRNRRSASIPFGPFISVASIFSYLWGADFFEMVTYRILL